MRPSIFNINSHKQNKKNVTLKVAGNMVCNDGAVLHAWALACKGLAWRSMWEVGIEIESGKLVTVLDEFAAPGNDIYAVFAQRRHLPLRIRTFVDFLRREYAQLGCRCNFNLDGPRA